MSPDKRSKAELDFDPRISVVVGDLTDIKADAIVCPALPDLDVMYVGVAGAIRMKSGERVFEEARAIGREAKRKNPSEEYPVPLFSAHLTGAGELQNAHHVIHSVAVNFVDGQLTCDAETISKSAWNVLEVADSNNVKSVAFPALGSGLYAVPLDESIGAIAQASDKYLQEHPHTNLEEIKIVTLKGGKPKVSRDVEVGLALWLMSQRPAEQPESKDQIKPSELSKPSYMLEAGDTTGVGAIKWIGVEATDYEGKTKKYLWWRNFKADINDDLDRYNTAAFIARLKLEMDVEATVGMPVDLGASNSSTEEAATIDEPDLIGVYVEAGKRQMFNFMTMMNGVKTEAELRQEKPVEFDEEFQRAKTLLPPKKSA